VASEALPPGTEAEPAYHAGRSRPKQARRGERIPSKLPVWRCDMIPGNVGQPLTNSGYAYLYCPRCGHAVSVWLEHLSASAYRTRPCFFCFGTAQLPPELHRYIKQGDVSDEPYEHPAE
jgi:hypothetical protein